MFSGVMRSAAINVRRRVVQAMPKGPQGQGSQIRRIVNFNCDGRLTEPKKVPASITKALDTKLRFDCTHAFASTYVSRDADDVIFVQLWNNAATKVEAGQDRAVVMPRNGNWSFPADAYTTRIAREQAPVGFTVRHFSSAVREENRGIVFVTDERKFPAHIHHEMTVAKCLPCVEVLRSSASGKLFQIKGDIMLCEKPSGESFMTCVRDGVAYQITINESDK